MSFCCFSQTLKPIVQKLNGDTLFCFSIAQSRELAKLLTGSTYSDSIANSLSIENQRLYAVLERNRKHIDNLNLQVQFKNQRIENQKESIHALEGIIKEKDKKLSRSKRQKQWILMGLAAFTIFSVIQ